MPSTNLVIGLTGGIGSGKSTVAELFANHGVPIVDSDQVARDLTKAGTPAFKAISSRFPHLILTNGELDRRGIRELIFADPEKRIWLEELLHPLIREEMEHQIAALTGPYCIAIIPLLLETPPNPIVSRILVVDTEEELQIARVAKRDVHSIMAVEAIIATQVSRKIRLDSADDIIFNSNGPEFLVPQVEKLHKFYLSLAKEIKG